MNEHERASQLSAMFDGELPAAECELLSRRLARDEQLRATWSRYAVIGAVIGEYIGSNAGLGHFILYASQTYDAPALFSGIVALILIVFLCNFALSWLERRLIRWRHIEGAAIQL